MNLKSPQRAPCWWPLASPFSNFLALYGLILLMMLPTETLAYYCVNGLCSAAKDEYCCGDAQCCNYSSSFSSWVFWVAILIFVVLASLIWGCLKLFCFERKVRHPLITE